MHHFIDKRHFINIQPGCRFFKNLRTPVQVHIKNGTIIFGYASELKDPKNSTEV